MRSPTANCDASSARVAEHVTLLASIDRRLIGIGEYIIGADPTEAEVAFAVADDHHREGVATLLLERLAVIAHERGLLTFTATVLPGNADMQLVFRTVGLAVRSRFDDGVIKTVLELASAHCAHRRRQRGASTPRCPGRHPSARSPGRDSQGRDVRLWAVRSQERSVQVGSAAPGTRTKR